MDSVSFIKSFLARISDTKKYGLFFLAVVILSLFFSLFSSASAAPNYQINYQGKLTGPTGSAVTDGTYSIVFRLYTVASGGAHIWTETNNVTVTSGLFSVMLGSSTSLASINFNQTLYLGLNVQADGEMSPRKILGTVPSAFEAKNANTVGGVASTSFLRSDEADTMAASTASTLLTITQNGAGDILNLFDGGTEVFTVLDGGNVGIGTTTPASKLQVLSTGEQLRLNYNAANYLSITTGLTGTTTFNSVGTSPAIMFGDNQFQLFDNADPTKRVDFQLSGITTGTKSTWTFPAGVGTFVGLSQTQTLINKTLTAPTLSSTTVSGIFKLSSLTASRGLFLDSQSRATTTALSATLLNSLTDETGTGVAVFSTSPTLTTPNLGTPSTLVGTNITGTAAAFTASNVTTNANLTGAITSVGNAASLGSFTTAQFATAITGETGTGVSVFNLSPVFGGTATFSALTATGTATFSGYTSLTSASTTNLTLRGKVFDVTNAVGTKGMVLQTTGTSTRWVATSTLGLGSGGSLGSTINATEMNPEDFGSFTCNGTTCTVDANSLSASMIANGDHGFFSYASNAASLDANGLTSANLISAVTDETGTGRLVFSTAPAFSGTVTFSALSATGTATFATTTQSGRLTLSGLGANIALGSNYLSGDGDDEGLFVTSAGNVGIGTTTPASKLQVLSTGEQLRLNYDTTNYLSVTTGATGTTTFNSVGTSPAIMFGDNQFQLFDNADPTKRVDFQLSGITTGTKSIWTFPAGASTFVGTNLTQTLTNKTLTAPTLSSTTVSGIFKLSSLTASRGLFLDSQSRATTTALSATLLNSLTDETGTGVVVFSVSPTFTGTPVLPTTVTMGTKNFSRSGTHDLTFVTAADSILSLPISGLLVATDSNDTLTSKTLTTPKIAIVQGGTAVGSSLTLQSTTGVGTTDFIQLIVGNNGATEALRVINSGNIGIGTSTPSQKLSVAGNFRLTGALYDRNNSAGTNGMVLQSNGSGTQWVATSTLGLSGGTLGSTVNATEMNPEDFGSFTCNGTICTVDANSLSASMIANGDHGFFSYASNAASLDANGLTSANLISAVSDETGTGRLVFSTAPAFSGTATFSSLTATGTATFATTTQSGRLTLSGLGANIALGSNWLSGDGDDEGVFVTSAGNVGIGTTTPNQKLSIFANGADAAIEFSTVSGANEKWTIGIDDSDNSKFKISSSSALGTNDRFVITGSGRVGIGDSSPSEELHVQLNQNGETNIYAVNTTNSGNSVAGFKALASGSTLGAQFGMSSAANTFSGGVMADRAWVYSHSDMSGINFYNAAAAPIIFTIDDIEAGRFSSTGNFGIGTTSPSRRLTVGGTSYFGGDVTATGTVRYSALTTSRGLFLDSQSRATTTAISFSLLNSLTDETGTGSVVFSTAPTFSGNVVFPASFQMSGTSFSRSGNHNLTLTTTAATNVTLPVSGTIYGTLASSITSANLISSVSDETGSGSLVFGTAPTLSSTTVSGIFKLSSQTASRGLFTDSQSRATTTALSATLLNSLTDETGTGVLVFGTAPTFTTSITSPALLASSNDSGALGASGTAFSDLFLASGSVINLNAGDVTLTHGSNALAFGGATSGYTFDDSITLSGTDNLILNGNYLSGDGDDEGVYVDGSGRVGIGTTTVGTNRLSVAGSFRVGTSTTPLFLANTTNGRIAIGTTTPQSTVALEKLSVTGNATAGIDAYYGLTNSTLNAVQYGNKSYIKTTNTATTSIVGNMIRLEDSTTYGNTLRGLEVQAQRGTNTKGENTALSGFARTFGVRGTTEGDAGSVFEPAGIFGQTKGTTQGNAFRAYSASITTAELVSLFQDTSAFTGTGLLMNFGNSGGSFSSTTSKFVDFQNGGTSKFVVTAHGTTTIGDGTTNNRAGLQIGYGGLCVDNDGACVASVAGRMSSVSTFTGNSDLAEMYFSSQNLKPGDIVVTDGFLSVKKATGDENEQILGVISTKPGLLLGSDDASLVANQKGYPLALSGRVPVRLSDENGPIVAGDPLMLSSISGVAMKATTSGEIVGYALEAFDGTYAYTPGYVDQFGDDIAQPNYEARDVNTDTRINDGCSYGAGGATGASDEECVKTQFEVVDTEAEEAKARRRYEAEKRAREELQYQSAELVSIEGKSVQVGQVIMFVSKEYHQLASQTNMLNELTYQSEGLVLGKEEGSSETLWSRLKSIAQNFVGGVLTIAGINTEKVETQQLCIDGVCVNGSQLRSLLEAQNIPQQPVQVVEENSPQGDTNNQESNSSGGESQQESPQTNAEPQPQTLPPPVEPEVPEGNVSEEEAVGAIEETVLSPLEPQTEIVSESQEEVVEVPPAE